jgi:hypothetical protein
VSQKGRWGESFQHEAQAVQAIDQQLYNLLRLQPCVQRCYRKVW